MRALGECGEGVGEAGVTSSLSQLRKHGKEPGGRGGEAGCSRSHSPSRGEAHARLREPVRRPLGSRVADPPRLRPRVSAASGPRGAAAPGSPQCGEG